MAVQVDGVLYRVPRYGFEQLSQSVFRDVFTIPQGDAVVEGSSDDHPIVLTGCTNQEFESFLKVMYTLYVPSRPHSSRAEVVFT